ncbi:MAG TPA: zeta toxin family protein [Puia sp.]|nr:zeta toxin family protein [Puia sp.]
MPELFIITGSNGAGKSSLGASYLPDGIKGNYPVFDGDKLFMSRQKELWAQGIRANKEVRNLANEYVDKLFHDAVDAALQSNNHFAYEGHFTNDATWEIPDRFRQSGYKVNLIFMGLRDPELSEMRVIDRSRIGGRYIPPPVIRDNFYGNLEKLDQYFVIIDNLKILDSSGVSHILLAQFNKGELLESVAYDELPAWFTNGLPTLSGKIQHKVDLRDPE